MILSLLDESRCYDCVSKIVTDNNYGVATGARTLSIIVQILASTIREVETRSCHSLGGLNFCLLQYFIFCVSLNFP